MFLTKVCSKARVVVAVKLRLLYSRESCTPHLRGGVSAHLEALPDWHLPLRRSSIHRHFLVSPPASRRCDVVRPILLACICRSSEPGAPRIVSSASSEDLRRSLTPCWHPVKSRFTLRCEDARTHEVECAGMACSYSHDSVFARQKVNSSPRILARTGALASHIFIRAAWPVEITLRFLYTHSMLYLNT